MSRSLPGTPTARAARTPGCSTASRYPPLEGALADLRATVGGADLAAPPVVLPDFHHKSNMELPSSVAVATRASVRPTLTSASVNCGMALIALNSARPAHGRESTSSTGASASVTRIRRGWARSCRPGMCWVVPATARRSRPNGLAPGRRFSSASKSLGRLDLDRYDGADRLQRELPGLVVQLARLRFGMVGPTNHFIELQEVEEVFEPDTAARLGVAPGQMTLQYHAGGGVFPGAVGAMFGRRKHYPRQIRAAMSVVKPLYHGMSARSLAQLRQRYRLYFAGGCPPVPLDSDEGRRLMLANAAAMNYGFAFRIADLRRAAPDRHRCLRRPAGAAGRGLPAQLHLRGDGRRRACRRAPAQLVPRLPGGAHAAGTTFAETGQAVLVPGTHRTSSYLCVAGGSADALYSACHGAGTVVSDFARRGISQPDSRQRATLRFRYDGAAPTSAAHFDDKGVNEVLARAGPGRARPAGGQDAPVRGSALRRTVTAHMDHSGTAMAAAGAGWKPWPSTFRPGCWPSGVPPAELRALPAGTPVVLLDHRPRRAPAGRAGSPRPARSWWTGSTSRSRRLRRAIVVVEDTSGRAALGLPVAGGPAARRHLGACAGPRGRRAAAPVSRGRRRRWPPGESSSGGRHDAIRPPSPGNPCARHSRRAPAARRRTCARC